MVETIEFAQILNEDPLRNWKVVSRQNTTEVSILDGFEGLGTNLPDLGSYASGVRYRNPLAKNFVNDVSNPNHRWYIAQHDKIGRALTKDFLERGLMKDFAFYDGAETEAPRAQINDEVWGVLNAIEATDYIMRAGMRMLVHGWQVTNIGFDPSINVLDLTEVIGEHEVYGANSKNTFFFLRATQSDADKQKFLTKQHPEKQITPLKVNDITGFRYAKSPILPLYRYSGHLRKTQITLTRSQMFHTTLGTYEEGYGNSAFASCWDSIIKLIELSENNHFRQSIWAQALVPPDFNPQQIKEYVRNALYALNNRQLFVNKAYKDENGMLNPDIPKLQFQNTVQGQNPSRTRESGGGPFNELNSEWANLCASTKYSIRYWTGNPGGALAAASEDTMADIKNDIARFNGLVKSLIRPFLKLLQMYNILPQTINFDLLTIKSWWQIELEKQLLASVGQNASMTDDERDAAVTTKDERVFKRETKEAKDEEKRSQKEETNKEESEKKKKQREAERQIKEDEKQSTPKKKTNEDGILTEFLEEPEENKKILDPKDLIHGHQIIKDAEEDKRWEEEAKLNGMQQVILRKEIHCPKCGIRSRTVLKDGSDYLCRKCYEELDITDSDIKSVQNQFIEHFKKLKEVQVRNAILDINTYMIQNKALDIEYIEDFTERMNQLLSRDLNKEYDADNYKIIETKDMRLDKLFPTKQIDTGDIKYIKLKEYFDQNKDNIPKIMSDLFPIVVDEGFSILDGNHRLQLIKDMDLDYMVVPVQIAKRKNAYNIPFSPFASSTVRGAALYDDSIYVQFHSQSGGGYKYQFGSEDEAADQFDKFSKATSAGGYVWDHFRGDQPGPAYGSGKMTPGGTTASLVPYDKVSRLPNVGFMGGGTHQEFRDTAEELKEFKESGIAAQGETSTILGDQYEWGADNPNLKTGELGTQRAYYPEEAGFVSKTPSPFYTEPYNYGEPKPSAKTPDEYHGTPERTGKPGRPQKGKTGFEQMEINYTEGQKQLRELTGKKEIQGLLEPLKQQYEAEQKAKPRVIVNPVKPYETLGQEFQPTEAELGTPEERRKAFEDISSLFKQRKQNALEIENIFGLIPTHPDHTFGIHMDLNLKKIVDEYPDLLENKINLLLTNPTNALNHLAHSKTTIYKKANDTGDKIRYNRLEAKFDKSDDDYWYAIVNGFSKTNPFHYLEDGVLVTEFQCEDDIKKQVGKEVPLGVYHNLEDPDSTEIPVWQMVGTYSVLEYDEETGTDISLLKTNKALVKEFFKNIGEDDWVNSAFELGLVPDISTAYPTSVKIKNKNGHDIRVQTGFELKSVSFVPRGNCSGKYCTGDLVRMNQDIRECIKIQIPKITAERGKLSFEELVKLALEYCKNKKD